jgi:hypothetical protein
VKLQRYFSVAFAFTLLLALAVGLTQAQQSAADGKDSHSPSSVEAVVTASFNYQGILRENDTPVTGSRDMVFNLHNANTCAAAPLDTVTQNGVPVNNGFFNVTLDFSQSNFDGKALWLEVVVAGTEIGCQELTTVPYALSVRPGARMLDTRPDYLLYVDNDGAGDGIRAFSNSTLYNYAALYGVNAANTGEGSGVFGSSNNGSGVYARSFSEEIAALRSENDSGPAGQLVAADATYGTHLENTGTGDGLRSYSNTSTGSTWAAVYAYNTGTGSGVYGASTGGYAGYFVGDIFVSGNCTGCLLVYAGLNGGNTPLVVGDLVAVSGVEPSLDGTSTPVLRLEAADATNGDAVLGVVQSAGQLVSGSRDGHVTESLLRAEGAAAPGDYLFIAVQGLVQVNVSGPLSAGDRIALTNGVTGRATDTAGLIIGRAVETSQQGGLVWVMLDIR